jgi:hypothetical protein
MNKRIKIIVTSCESEARKRQVGGRKFEYMWIRFVGWADEVSRLQTGRKQNVNTVIMSEGWHADLRIKWREYSERKKWNRYPENVLCTKKRKYVT